MGKHHNICLFRSRKRGEEESSFREFIWLLSARIHHISEIQHIQKIEGNTPLPTGVDALFHKFNTYPTAAHGKAAVCNSSCCKLWHSWVVSQDMREYQAVRCIGVRLHLSLYHICTEMLWTQLTASIGKLQCNMRQLGYYYFHALATITHTLVPSLT